LAFNQALRATRPAGRQLSADTLGGYVKFIGHSPKPPDEVLTAIASLGHARAVSYASARIWSPTRIYTRTEGARFQAARGGGSQPTAAICKGVVELDGIGSRIPASFRFGILPSWFPRAALVFVLVASFALAAHFWPPSRMLWVFTVTAVVIAVLNWWSFNSEIRSIQRIITEAGTEITWERDG
jgi:hypothetical protein